MSCEAIREKLTPYLDGDLEGDAAMVVRGHLRECAACREVSVEEAKLRDALRELPTVDPPASMWAGIQAQLAASEVAAAKQPGWRRMLARWRARVEMSRFALGGMAVAAAAVVLIYVKSQRGHADDRDVATLPPTPVEVDEAPAKPAPATPDPDVVPADVTADIADEPRRIAKTYAAAADEALALADTSRAAWTDAQRAAFDKQVTELRANIAAATEPREIQRGYRALIRYAQTSVAREPIAMLETP